MLELYIIQKSDLQMTSAIHPPIKTFHDNPNDANRILSPLIFCSKTVILCFETVICSAA